MKNVEYCQWTGYNKQEMIQFLESAGQPYLINRHHLFIRFSESYDKVPEYYYVVKKNGVILRNFIVKP